MKLTMTLFLLLSLGFNTFAETPSNQEPQSSEGEQALDKELFLEAFNFIQSEREKEEMEGSSQLIDNLLASGEVFGGVGGLLWLGAMLHRDRMARMYSSPIESERLRFKEWRGQRNLIGNWPHGRYGKRLVNAYEIKTNPIKSKATRFLGKMGIVGIFAPMIIDGAIRLSTEHEKDALSILKSVFAENFGPENVVATLTGAEDLGKDTDILLEDYKESFLTLPANQAFEWAELEPKLYYKTLGLASALERLTSKKGELLDSEE